ncbi:hypothetical protein EDM56_10575 [Brevibacillus fluminis]|uniref:Uncharacterized protein n=1 Tax=Brevibacillus fluminis TaxID=511487 RepID=A0A3M8DQA9_9BACL|nr:hypothetical protein [Brevibacillus fluminis]RNB89621.1 hypothetical protein EDM56_10575 [Brevibacillus fluminis]
MKDWKPFAAGFDLSKWCLGIQFHDCRQKYGYGVVEVNILPLRLFIRFGNGMKRLYCQWCDDLIDYVDPEESESVSCLKGYEKQREWRERDASRT